ncbi:MAG: ABC transporter ATP-binding protein [Firmicutes bacterium]|nr:ABC transporter ATP-binding protein [Bacillota bacterium]
MRFRIRAQAWEHGNAQAWTRAGGEAGLSTKSRAAAPAVAGDRGGAGALAPDAQCHLDVLGIRCSYGAWPVLRDVTFQIQRGDRVCLVGPNGAGKSTLLRCITQVLHPQAGTVRLAGVPMSRLDPRQIARRIAVVPQAAESDFEFTVYEMVAMGRNPHLKAFAAPGPADLATITRAMEQAAVAELAERPFATLSGGEQQRVLLARALAQEPEILLLDEPTAHLDIAYQVEMMDLLCQLNETLGVTILAAVHDLNLASQYFGRVLLLAQGRILAAGTPEEVMQPDILQQAYGVQVTILHRPDSSALVVLPVGRKREGA